MRRAIIDSVQLASARYAAVRFSCTVIFVCKLSHDSIVADLATVTNVTEAGVILCWARGASPPVCGWPQIFEGFPFFCHRHNVCDDSL